MTVAIMGIVESLEFQRFDDSVRNGGGQEDATVRKNSPFQRTVAAIRPSTRRQESETSPTPSVGLWLTDSSSAGVVGLTRRWLTGTHEWVYGVVHRLTEPVNNRQRNRATGDGNAAKERPDEPERQVRQDQTDRTGTQYIFIFLFFTNPIIHTHVSF